MVAKKSHKPGSLRKELTEVDSELVRLLARRCDLLDRHLQERRSKSQSLSDPEMEKGLWHIWQEESRGSGLNERLLRRAFHLLNSLAYDRTERPPEKEFLLRPRTDPAAVDLEGPRERMLSRMFLSLAAASGGSLRLERPVMNDALYDLLKALQQVGAKVSWESSAVWAEAWKGTEFNAKSIYAGGDLLNLYLLVFLATLQPGSCKFTGSTRLRLADLGPLMDLLPRLGARGVSILPGNKGLPLRVEASGSSEEEIPLPDDAPMELGAALVLCCGFFHAAQRRMRLTWSSGSGWGKHLEPACEVLAACGVDFALEPGCLSLEPGARRMPRQPDLTLDPELGAYLLALPRFLGGWIRLTGRFPAGSSRRAEITRVLGAFDVFLQEQEDAVVSGCGELPPNQPELDLRGEPWVVPLAVSLALAAGGASLHLPQGEGMDFAVELARTLGAEFSVDGALLRIASSPEKTEERLELTSPDSGWSMALALISLLRPGIVLRNPGELHGEWPHFWTLYNGLPRPQEALADREEKGRSRHGSKRRRFIVE
ncbi:MAG: chorismate mutase [Desulfohalobiaceae bacterium]|nr:chorismate mutase [Desulfohalobiaceae bacterium]